METQAQSRRAACRSKKSTAAHIGKEVHNFLAATFFCVLECVVFVVVFVP